MARLADKEEENKATWVVRVMHVVGRPVRADNGLTCNSAYQGRGKSDENSGREKKKAVVTR